MSEYIDDSHRRLARGETWRQFCGMLEEAGEAVLAEVDDANPLDVAEGHRYLTRLLRGAFETFIEFGDPRAPVLRRTCHETIKMGADNPDNHYWYASVNGKFEYRVYGSRGTVHYLGLGTQSGNYGSTGNLAPTGYLDDTNLIVDADGNFEVVLSREPQEGNWLPLSEASRTLVIRQSFLDRDGETPALLHIERIDADNRPKPLTTQVMDRGLMGAARFVQGSVELFARWVRGFREAPNQLPRFDSAVADDAGGVPHIVYYHGYWQIEEDEALIVEVVPPECDYWNFQLNNIWMESLDYRYFDVVVNNHTARLESDGTLRIVVSHKDHGVGNWMDPCGHSRGTMCLRWVRSEQHPSPSCRVVKVSELTRG